MEIKKILNYSILRVSKDKLLLANKYKLDVIISIIKDKQKKFLIEKKRFTIPKY